MQNYSHFKWSLSESLKEWICKSGISGGTSLSSRWEGLWCLPNRILCVNKNSLKLLKAQTIPAVLPLNVWEAVRPPGYRVGRTGVLSFTQLLARGCREKGSGQASSHVLSQSSCGPFLQWLVVSSHWGKGDISLGVPLPIDPIDAKLLQPLPL